MYEKSMMFFLNGKCIELYVRSKKEDQDLPMLEEKKVNKEYGRRINEYLKVN